VDPSDPARTGRKGCRPVLALGERLVGDRVRGPDGVAGPIGEAPTSGADTIVTTRCDPVSGWPSMVSPSRCEGPTVPPTRRRRHSARGFSGERRARRSGLRHAGSVDRVRRREQLHQGRRHLGSGQQDVVWDRPRRTHPMEPPTTARSPSSCGTVVPGGSRPRRTGRAPGDGPTPRVVRWVRRVGPGRHAWPAPRSSPPNRRRTPWNQ
jgi:hypothetical protein